MPVSPAAAMEPSAAMRAVIAAAQRQSECWQTLLGKLLWSLSALSAQLPLIRG